MQDLTHENIVQHLGSRFDAANGTLDIYMEFVAGGSVASVVTAYGALGDPVLARFTSQMLRGVAYLHSRNVIHRDIKGGNVLIDMNGTAKLADFGCSKLLHDMKTQDREETLCRIRGSIPWMAPEMVRETRYHFPADIWSLGATVLEMASGKRPWPDCAEQFAAIFAIGSTKGPPPIPDFVSIRVRDFLLECFNLKPEMRPTAAKLLEHPLVASV